MDEQKLAAIEHRLEWALSDLAHWDRYRQGNYREGWGADELLALVDEVRRLRAALGCISRYGPRVQIPTAISCASAALQGNGQPCSYLHEHGEQAR